MSEQSVSKHSLGQSATSKQAVGRAGEDFSCGWLQERGFDVVERNWRCARGELDLICLDRATGELVGVEVKTRSGTGYGHPAEAVNSKKLKRLHSLLGEYARSEGGREWCGRPRRVDVLALLWPAARSSPRAVDHYVGVIA